jgi:murein DD-endopeptidase MepM/ murein hydrolase activator NlpD
MKKTTLLEEIKRIHELTYNGKTTLVENDLWDLITGKKKDEKKADVVEPELDTFYKSLDSASQTGLSQRQAGQMDYQKEVESMQIGLELLGYDLPRYGVDGKFGPETASTVRKFKEDNLGSLKESAAELRDTLSDLGYAEKGSEISSGGEISNGLSGIVSKILADFKKTNPGVKVTVTSGNDRFHKKLGYKSAHTLGQAVDITLSPYNQNVAGVFRRILDMYIKGNSFSYIDEYENPSKSATGGHFHLQFTGSQFQEPQTNTQQPINEMVAVVPDGGGIIGAPGQGTHSASDWQSGNAWDVTGPAGSKVLSITNGVISKNRKGSNQIVSSGVKKIFGDQVTVTSSDGKPDVFYTHVDCDLAVGTQVKEGDVIGTIMQAEGMTPHVHVGLSRGSLKDLSSGLKNGGGGGSEGGTSDDQPMEQATPEMLKKMIAMLQAKRITKEDINKYTNVVGNVGNISFTGGTDNEFYKAILTGVGAPVTPENLKFLYAWRQAEGSGGVYNPFNTTMKADGATSINSDGVKVYTTPEQGLNATVKTILLPTYRCISDGLRQNIGADRLAACPCLDTWGTTTALVSKVVDGYNAGHPPKIRTVMA